MSISYSDKQVVKILLDTFVSKGLKHIVISPGSRNAPLILSFTNSPSLSCYTIVDERSAAFFALGMAQQLDEPVALICTSGTAALNYAPAIAEAYYQKIPLLVITADRPFEWVDQEDGQTINQNGIYSNYCKFSSVLPIDIYSKDDEWYTKRVISEAFYHCKNKSSGPVHINIPLREPLYGKKVYEEKESKVVEHLLCEKMISNSDADNLAKRISEHPSVMLIVGMQKPNEQLNSLLTQLSQHNNVVILTETTANLSGEAFISNIDRACHSIKREGGKNFAPTLLLTINGPIISRLIKSFLRSNPPQEQWHIDTESHHLDPFQALTLSIESSPIDFFSQIIPRLTPSDSTYKKRWIDNNNRCINLAKKFSTNLPWCDFKVHEIIYSHLPNNYRLQLGNSTPVRYSQLFDIPKGVKCFSNRGTSGIDGSISTAAGAAFATNSPTLLIVGDLSAMYDSNGLWHNYLDNNLKIIIINNSGGGIFRFIEGSSTTAELEEYFEASQTNDFSHLAALHKISYLKATNEAELRDLLPNFFHSEGCQILEIVTPAEESAYYLKKYFETIKNKI